MEKLDCSVLSAVTAACKSQMSSWVKSCLAYRVVALRHSGEVVLISHSWKDAPTVELPPRDHEHEGMAWSGWDDSGCGLVKDR
jgi:hypothetical protein